MQHNIIIEVSDTTVMPYVHLPVKKNLINNKNVFLNKQYKPTGLSFQAAPFISHCPQTNNNCTISDNSPDYICLSG